METQIALIIVVLVMASFMWKQQRTIDRLTDKLMAKDYSEYKRHSSPLMREEPKTRKPKSFYDDASVEIDDEVQ